MYQMALAVRVRAMCTLILSPDALVVKKVATWGATMWAKGPLSVVVPAHAPESMEGGTGRSTLMSHEPVRPVRDEEVVERGKGLRVGHDEGYDGHREHVVQAHLRARNGVHMVDEGE